ncbi:RagB/SusD family nutrient uptake outer membrane protein [Faecalibacter macacae]|uniref:RagB/SusD family nutrient uptake outer membrane protein n=1 Tax=Faecalibacter macacae TaxID=1859289 RepID=A0A3L9M8W7_9FLAO|nr:RagB/SusD family nutrient uptake outer membrane protein [Faecalibacter macacae]RLZ09231.1 RagB/SusD family nutrient uptake outer membrane protein [Faecalibacter macacae]
MKGKNLFKIALLALVPLFYSCDEERLDERPLIGDIFDANNGMKNEEQMERFVIGAYSGLASGTNFGANILIYGDVISDNIFVSTTNDGYFLTENSLSWIGDSGFGQYSALYTVIQRANFVINDTNLEETENVKKLKGEAKIIRGLAYFYLVQLFSPNPTSGINQEYGVPLKLELYTDPMATVGRSTVDEVYAQIVKDLEEGGVEIGNLNRGSKTYLSPTAAKFILSKVLLTRGRSEDYSRAASLANEVLTSSPANFSRIQSDQLYDYFTATDVAKSEEQNETIWEIEQTQINNLGVNSHISAFYSNTGAHRSMLARQSFYNTFETSDVRRALFNTSGTPASDDPKGVWLRKWPRNTTLNNVTSNYTMNVKVFRMTEALFVQMEAMAKSGQQGQAVALLNEFTASRGSTITYNEGNVLQGILEEKKKEFIGEGHRFFDLKRNNLPINKGTNCGGARCDVDANDKIFVLPIPRTERDLVPEIKQYPGW